MFLVCYSSVGVVLFLVKDVYKKAGHFIVQPKFFLWLSTFKKLPAFTKSFRCGVVC